MKMLTGVVAWLLFVSVCVHAQAAQAATPDPECVAGNTIVNKTVDCAGIELGLGCDSDKEGQKPVLTLKNASVKNLVLSKTGGADGIHCREGDCVLENVVWLDICEDAATLTKQGKSLTIIGGAVYNYKDGPGGKPDKIFQHNSLDSTLTIKGGFKIIGEHGKLWRSCGNCTGNGGPRHLVLDDVEVDGHIDSIAGLNRNYGDTVKIKNLNIKNYKPGKPKVCVEYEGIEKNAKQESKKYGEQWDSEHCIVGREDVIAF